VNKSDLRVDWATHEAAKYACEHWHYSGCLPAGKLVKIGIWECGLFVGVVIFGRGANNNMSKAFNLGQDEACELVRIALTRHGTSVTRAVRVAILFLRKNSPGLRLIVSYADPSQGHHGGIYQAGNWVYTGKTTGTHMLRMPGGALMHKRSAMAKYGTCDSRKLGAKYEYPEQKHRYLMPLDADMRARVLPLAKPYPKRDKQAMTGDHSEQRRGSADRHAPHTLS
jgi:hypothetical protein